jgi:hypothetical protein
MSEDSEWRWIRSSRPGRCRQCSTAIQTGEMCLYSWKQREIWCLQCAESMGHRPERNSSGGTPRGNPQEGVSGEARTEPNSPYSNGIVNDVVVCSLCGERISRARATTYFGRDSFTQYIVCEFCSHVIVCQAHAKMAGLWVVPRKPEPPEGSA